MNNKKLMRDAFIGKIYEKAQRDRDVIFISADFGAAALDDFRDKLPKQFIHAGISEQNMVDVGAGLALSGKKVFLYAMAPFITTRCYEQTKAVVSSMNLPITFIAVGVGLGYDHATLTHFTPEDIAIMKALNGIEILSPADSHAAEKIADYSVENPKFRYVRLERKALPNIYDDNFLNYLEDGFHEITEGKDVCVISSGYLLHKAMNAYEQLQKENIEIGVIDLFKIKPVNTRRLANYIKKYKKIITFEEQLLNGGFGSAVGEILIDEGLMLPLKRIGIQDGFEIVNGNRDYLHKLYNIDTPDLISTIKEII